MAGAAFAIRGAVVSSTLSAAELHCASCEANARFVSVPRESAADARRDARHRDDDPAVALRKPSTPKASSSPAGQSGTGPNTSLVAGAVPLLGSTVSSEAQLAQNTSEFGHMPIVHIYYTGLPTANAWTTGLAAANNSAIVVSFNATPSSILSGADDAVLSHFFDTAPRSYPIYYSYIHEPEHEVQAGMNLGQYLAAWPRVVALANAAHNPYLHSIDILEAYDLKPGSHRSWQSYVPGGGIISTLGWDAYSGGGTHNPPADFMAAAVAASKSAGMPFGFCEFGSPNEPGRAAWLSEIGNFLLQSGALFGTLFDSPNVTPSFMVTDPGSISVWRSFVQASVSRDLG